jgi:asparagine synthase (glutamine-hydrolysing)
VGALAGWVAGRNAPDENAIGAMLQALGHRAAGGGIYALQSESGHRVVLGEAYYDEDAGIAVALDGSIANRAELQGKLTPRGYRFATGGAGELLARAYEHWDKDVVHHLRGAFAFAIWDARKDRLMLARDRMGEKPLYLSEQGTLFFASEIKALLKAPGIKAQADPGAVRDYLAYRYVPGPRTLVSGIRKLLPGTYALWQFGRTKEVRYWTAPDRNPRSGQVARDPVAQFTEKLDEAVRLQSPGAVLLSGGLDSAMLVALASRHGPLKTYSAGFADDPDSELPGAAQVAKQFGTQHHEIVLSPRDVVSRLAQVVAHRDAPVARPADVALHFMACEIARSSTAVMTGEGGDAVLGGQRRHLAEHYGWAFRSMPTLLMVAAPLAHSRPHMQSVIASLRTSDTYRRYVRWNGAVGFSERDALLGRTEKANPLFDADPRASSLRRALYFDQSSWLPDDVLERADRMTMAASLEARAPFLDHRLVEFVSTLPDDQRVRGFATKWILRQAARPLLGGLRPRKGGFGIHAGTWLRGELRELLLDHLRGPGSLTRPYYEPRVLDRVLDQHLAGRRDHETLLWTLLNLEIWHRTSLQA